jgi:hypothetical protein
MWMQRRWIPVAVTGLMMISSAVARAADSREAREREARKACFTGNVDRGVEILVDLYGETGHPNYIYNQARCFERNGKYDQAVLSYEDYLRKANNLGQAERAQVEKSIAELRAKVGAPATPGASGGTGAPALLTPELDATAPDGNGKPSDAVLLPPGGEEPTVRAEWPWQRKAGVASLVVAGGGLALGVAGTVLRSGRASDFDSSCTTVNGEPVARMMDSGADCRGRHEAVQAAERMMWIGYVGAGVAASAGVTLLLLAPRSAPGVWAQGCAPALGGNTGISCAWRF